MLELFNIFNDEMVEAPLHFLTTAFLSFFGFLTSFFRTLFPLPMISLQL